MADAPPHASAPASASSSTLTLLTFNVWGLRFVSKDRDVRIRAIAAYLASNSSRYDVVCLQELWINSDFEFVRRELADVLPHSRFFHTGALGSGLAIFTRFPIVGGQAMPYALSGTPLEVIAGDFFVNKAAGKIVIRHPQLGEVEVWNTHMHAAGDDGKETRRAHRLTQAWQLAQQIKAGVERGRHILLAGDFNSIPVSLPIAILTEHAELVDSWGSTHPHAATAPVPADAHEGLDVHGMTCDSLLNSYSAGKPLTDDARKWHGKRLDYIFYRSPRAADEQVECTSSEVTLTERVPGRDVSYSDHFGLMSTFTWRSGARPSSTPLVSVSSRSTPEEQRPASVNASAATTLRSALAIIRAYHDESRSLARLHWRIFWAALLFGLSLTVSSAWQPKSWIQPIWTLLGIGTGALAATMLYTGFIWGRWENNLLKEMIEQIEVEL